MATVNQLLTAIWEDTLVDWMNQDNALSRVMFGLSLDPDMQMDEGL